MSDQSSSRRPSADYSNACSFLDHSTLLFRHNGPRALLLGDFQQFFQPRTHLSQDLSRESLSLSGSSQGRRSSGRLHQSMGRSGISTRVERRRNATVRLGFTQEELQTYEDFAKLLANFEPEEMFDIASDVLRQAKS